MKPLWENVNDVSRLLRTIDKPVPCGALADTDIWDAIYRGEIYISPFHSENLTAADYNLQVSDIIISTRSGLPLKIYTSGQYRYVDVPANDTVLITTVESIFVGPQIMGTFHSRVSIVSQGFGHISTTLDPTWCGPLLIAVNNPSNRKKRFVISDSSGTHSFATLVFYRLIHPAEAINSKPPIRTDVLGTYLQEPKGLKKFLIGRAYSQYERLVDKLKCAGTYNDGGLKDPRTNIEQIVQLLIEIRAQYKAAGCLTNIRELSRLDAILVQQKTAADLPPLCLDMLKILQAALAQRKELSRKTDRFGQEIVCYIDICLMQLRREQQAYHWTQSYMECSAIAQKEAFSNNWMRFIMGLQPRRVLKYLLWVVAIAVALILLVFRKERLLVLIQSHYKDPDMAKATVESIWTVAWGVLSATIILIVNDLFKGDQK